MTEIVLPVHNALEHLRVCLATIEKTMKNYRLIVVDDASDRPTRDFLNEYQLQHPSTMLLHTDKQRWFTRAVNFGLRMVKTNRALVLNSDCEFFPGWYEELISVWRHAQIEGNVALVGSVFSEEAKIRWEATREPGYVTGHCWLINVDAFAEMAKVRGTPGWYLNELDPSQIHINSDRIGCYELNRLGYMTVASYKSAVKHHGGASWAYKLSSIPSSVQKVN